MSRAWLRAPDGATITYMERRRASRALLQGAFANKFIEGVPHTVDLVDVSETGLQVRRILEPSSAADSFALEVSAFGVRFFAWAKRVWARGDREAYRFVGVDPLDQARLRKALRCA